MIEHLTERELTAFEWQNRRQGGFDVPAYAASTLAEMEDEALRDLRDRLASAPLREDWPYEEPSDELAIVSELPPPRSTVEHGASLRNRLAGAWLGRVAGNMLGKPVEVGWTRHRLDEYLRASGSLDSNGQLTDWIVADPQLAEEYSLEASWPMTTRGGVAGTVRDDDVDYTVLALLLMEAHGAQVSADDVAHAWLSRLPYLQVFTAERVAYANLVAGIRPSLSARTDNPFDEWIGALIRADAYGMALPGRAREAALLALRDASVSHTRNGAYGAMWSASLVSHALVTDSTASALALSLDEVPRRSRLAAVVARAIELWHEGETWDTALSMLDDEFGLAELHHVHVLNNAAVISAALLWGQDDPGLTIGLAVRGGLDTDSNAATTGAVVGAILGIDALPAGWLRDLDGQVRTGLFGVGTLRLDELVDRTYELALSFASNTK